jgi:hypothetical protein
LNSTKRIQSDAYAEVIGPHGGVEVAERVIHAETDIEKYVGFSATLNIVVGELAGDNVIASQPLVIMIASRCTWKWK